MSEFSHLKALYINTSLKKKIGDSHTQLLLDTSANLMAGEGVAIEHVDLLSYKVPPGVYLDIKEHGWAHDDWPVIWEKVTSADILIVGTPFWFGEESSVCRVLI